MDLLWSSLACVLLLGSILGSAYSLSSLGYKKAFLLLRLASTIVIALGLVTVEFHILMLVKQFNLLAALSLNIIGFGILLFKYNNSFYGQLKKNFRYGRLLISLIEKSPYRGRIYFFLACSIPLIIRTSYVLNVGHDAIVYHISRAAFWVQTNQLSYMPANGPGQWSMYGLFWGGAEVLQAWAILPFHSDVFVPFIDVIEWIMLGIALFAFCRELRIREPYGSLAVAFILNIPTVRLLVGSGYVEPFLNVTLIFGIYFGIRYLKQHQWIDLLLTMTALGLAGATKLPGLFIAGLCVFTIGVVGLIIIPRKRQHLLAMVTTLSIFIGSIVPWIALSISVTGYPLSPFPIKLGGFLLGKNHAMEWLINNTKYLEPYVFANEWKYLTTIFPLPGSTNESLGILSVAPVIFAPLGIIFLLRKNIGSGLFVMVSLFASLWTAFGPDISQIRMIWVVSSSRFILPLLMLFIVLGYYGCSSLKCGLKVATLGWIITAYHGLYYLFHLWHTHEIIFMFTVIFTSAFIYWGLIRINTGFQQLANKRSSPYLIVGCICLIVSGTIFLIASYKAKNRYNILSQISVLHPLDKYWVGATKRVDQIAQNHIIALTSGPTLPCIWFSHYFLGSRLQNRLIYISPLPDGRMPEFCPGNGWEPQADFETWYQRLKNRGAHYVMSFGPRSIELQWMEKMPELFHREEGGKNVWGLFAVK